VRPCRRADRFRRSGPAGKSVVQAPAAPAGCRCTVQGTDLARQLFGFRRYITTTAAGQTSLPAGHAVCLLAPLCDCVRVHQEEWGAVTAALAGRPGAVRGTGAVSRTRRALCPCCRPPAITSRPNTTSHEYEQLGWKPRVRPRRVRMQPWLLRRRWRWRGRRRIIMIGAARTRD